MGACRGILEKFNIWSLLVHTTSGLSSPQETLTSKQGEGSVFYLRNKSYLQSHLGGLFQSGAVAVQRGEALAPRDGAQSSSHSSIVFLR